MRVKKDKKKRNKPKNRENERYSRKNKAWKLIVRVCKKRLSRSKKAKS